MRIVSTLTILFALAAVSKANIPNPFSNSFRGGVVAPQANSGVSSLPNFTSSNVAAAPAPVPQVSTTTTTTFNAPQVATTTVVQQPAASQGHSHPIPNFGPPPVTPPPTAHSHGPRISVPQAAPGFPHMHSGHPYVAPAVAPQRMTYQQIIEYLVNTNGTNITSVLRNGSGNFLAQCKAYCDTLPPSPVCDASNILYRNECEAKCIHRTVTTSNLRYGICCCSDDDYNYDVDGNVFISTVATVNFCISTCIFNCLGGESPIESQHSSDSPALVLGRSSARCSSIN